MNACLNFHGTIGGFTALHYAVKYHKYATLIQLLEAGIDPNGLSCWGLTPIFSALNNAEKMNVLIKYGADVNIKSLYQETPLHHCTNVESAFILLESGADLSAADNQGFTPYDRMVEKGRDRVAEIVKNYVRSPERIQARTKLIKEELMAAAWHPDRVQKWLEADALDTMM